MRYKPGGLLQKPYKCCLLLLDRSDVGGNYRKEVTSFSTFYHRQWARHAWSPALPLFLVPFCFQHGFFDPKATGGEIGTTS